jgi:prophage regulatory protein
MTLDVRVREISDARANAVARDERRAGQGPPRLLRLRDVLLRTALGRSTLYARVKAGTFPAPIPLGTPHSVAWIESEVSDWIEATIAAARRAAPSGTGAGVSPGGSSTVEPATSA